MHFLAVAKFYGYCTCITCFNSHVDRAFIFYSLYLLDIKLDKSEGKIKEEVSAEDEFKIKDILFIINIGFWYIAILCVLFYGAVFPFLFYATDLMVNKYDVSPNLAGAIPALLPFGTMILTPVFGGIYDKYGKGATIMIIGSMILIFVHGVLAIPTLTLWWVAAAMVIVLGVGFSLVPAPCGLLFLRLFRKNNWVLPML